MPLSILLCLLKYSSNKEDKMDLKFLTESLTNLGNLAKNFNKDKAQALIAQLKAAKPEDLSKLMEMIKPLAGGKVHALITQLMSKIDTETIAQFQKTITSLNVAEIQSMIKSAASGGLNDLMGKAKDIFGSILNKK
jgi:phage-related tail protein